MFKDRPATLVYLDPPYFTRRKHNYRHDTNDETFHVELLELCNKARCMLIISGYDSKLYRSILSPKNGWKRTAINTNTRDTTGRDHPRTEMIWRNKHCTTAMKKERVPIRLNNQEKANNKINPIRKK